MSKRFLLISGMMRSGTTLLEKLLCNHPALSVLAQPFPNLYIKQKKDFLRSLGYNDAMPLDVLFGENRYTKHDLTSFLTSTKISKTSLIETLTQIKSYTGAMTSLDADLIKGYNPQNFFGCIQFLLMTFAHKNQVAYYGSKEVVCEEFMPSLVENNFKCIIILRNPLDVLTSLNYGTGKNFTGTMRPTLFNLRAWRKSVAFSILLDSHPNFMAIRYEDLVQDTFASLAKIASFLDISNFEEAWFSSGILDQKKRPWLANSSHHGDPFISSKSIGHYKNILPKKSQQFIMATCFPEMNLINYQCEETIDFQMSIENFKEPAPITRAEFNPGYSSSVDNIRMEANRINLLTAKYPPENQINSYFLNRKVYETLKQNATK